MPTLDCTVRRTGDYESRTEEYELVYSVGASPSRSLNIKYQAARAYEINAALDAAVETAREAIADDDAGQRGPTHEALAKFSWRAVQAAKYEEGEPAASSLEY
ncbi:MAG TPA: hypothetical protein VFY59_15285 [Rubrobacter sp.]|nr:hypothetical protein [Rubrobacter sp.]